MRINHEKTIRKWIKYAFARGVQRLELDLLEKGEKIRFCHSCTFPDPLGMRTGTLSQGLRSEYCDFQSLRNLCLKCVNVSGQVLEYFLHNCPLLECLVVHGSSHLKSLEVTGQSLKLTHLEICSCYSSKFIKVSNTNLVSLIVEKAGKLQLHNVPMLVEVSVSDWRADEDFSTFFSPFSWCFSQLEVLTLNIRTKKIEKMELQEFPELTNLKQLVLVPEAWEDRSLIGIKWLMKACPFLQKFVLKLVTEITVTRRGSFKKATKSPLQHLKVVELSGYCGITCELELLMYILENATALEKVLIDPRIQGVSRVPLTYDQIEQAEDARLCAEELLQVIPEHVELVIL